MINESTLLAACLESAKAYKTIRKHVNISEFSPLAERWVKAVDEWYARDQQAKRVDRELLRQMCQGSLPEKHKSTLLDFYDSIPQAGEVSAENVEQAVLEFKRQTIGQQLASALLNNDKNKAAELVTEYGELNKAQSLKNSEIIEATDDFMELAQTMDAAARIPLSPGILTARCRGGARRGDHIVVFGRTEVGKSLFVINMACHFARTGHRVLYVGNEDGIDIIKQRMVCNLSDMPIDDVVRNIELAKERCYESGYENLILRWGRGLSCNDVEELILDTEPDILVLDQIRNMRPVNSKAAGNLTMNLETVAQEVRGLIGRYDLVGLSVTQANAAYADSRSKLDERYLKVEQIDSSKTGLPGQADLLLGIGADDEDKAHNRRVITLCKNKLSGNHDPIMVTIDPQRSKVLD